MRKIQLKQGFTFIEIAILLAVSLILAAILIPCFAVAKAQSQVSACGSNMKNIATAIKIYTTAISDVNPVYPETLQVLSPKYIAKMPLCPTSHKPYLYEIKTRDDELKPIYTIRCPNPDKHRAMKELYFSSEEGLQIKR